METTNELAEKLKGTLKDKIVEIKVPRQRRIFVRVKQDVFHESLAFAVQHLGFDHLSTITGVDLGTEIEVLYHLTHEDSVVLSIAYRVPKENPSAKTSLDILPAAILYEQEVHELLGVNFEGHPNQGPLFLPEEWPKDVYPLRRDRSFDELKKIGSKT